ncbi:hypothetical protein PVAR5_4843 [Paecilomyces variotii No. 5]|uniref:Uncharacterized protein n=1 Tax=Byssochlamys spectabilis (strain No. 5 / NBRC 109023) TaxID=1356009 RepID=V5FVU3_BYSSN|nr:hypothetical protein PVAR5_4843 [Paecilomyces variotii No. 5]
MAVSEEALEATEAMAVDTGMDVLCMAAMAMESLGVDGHIQCTKVIKELVPPDLDVNACQNLITTKMAGKSSCQLKSRSLQKRRPKGQEDEGCILIFQKITITLVSSLEVVVAATAITLGAIDRPLSVAMDHQITTLMVILDRVIPSQDGIGVLATLQNTEANPNMSLGITTAKVDGDTIIAGAEEATATTMANRVTEKQKMFGAWGAQFPGQHYAGGHGQEHHRSAHFHAHFDQAGFGQGFDHGFEEDFGHGFGQGLGQRFGPGFGQAFGQGGGFNQGAHGHAMQQGYAYDDAYVGGYARRRPRRRRAHSVPPGVGVNQFVIPTGFAPPGMQSGQYQTPMGQFVGQHPSAFASGSWLQPAETKTVSLAPSAINHVGFRFHSSLRC